VHTFTTDIVGDPTLIKDVISSAKQPLQTIETPPKITLIAYFHSTLKE